MKETKHDYQNCLCGNFYDSKMTGVHQSWNAFKENWQGFTSTGYDDTYHFVFRYDIHLCENGSYQLELCAMLQRKGIYVHIWIENITQEELDGEIRTWLLERKKYVDSLWDVI